MRIAALSRLATWLKPSPLKAGVAVTLLLILAHPRLGLAPEALGEFLQAVDERARDTMFAVRGPTDRTAAQLPVAIVDLDEKSLAAVGQWPWPRDVVAAMLMRIHAAGPKAVGLDIVFAEPDRTSFKNHLPTLAALLGAELPDGPAEDGGDLPVGEALAAFNQLTGADLPANDEILLQLDHDELLARVVGALPELVVAYFLQVSEDDAQMDAEAGVPISWQDAIHRMEGAMAGSPFVPVRRPILNIPEIENAARNAGCVTTGYQAAGQLRYVPLVWKYTPPPQELFGELLRQPPRICPTLSLEMLRVGERLPNGHVFIDQDGVHHVELGERILPTDSRGSYYVNYRGPSRTFDYISAVDVLQRPGEVADRLAGKYVLVGTSAEGLKDIRSQPFDEACPGVEIHATLLDNLLQGDHLARPGWAFAAELVAILAAGLLVSLVLVGLRPLQGAAGAVAILAGLVAADYFLMFGSGFILNVTYPFSAGVLAALTVTTFNYFTEGRQKRFLKHAFSTYLSPTLVDQLVEHPEKVSLAGEERELSVLFSDIRGFTPISEGLSPEGLSQFLNEYLTPMTDAVMATRGTVDKYMGDAVMAFWGAPIPDAEHVANACRCALLKMRRLRDRQPEWQARGLPPIDIGIGINTGVMRVGNMGSEKRFDYTVMGDAVNLGSRLEGLNKPYGTNIIVSEFAHAHVADGFFFRLLDKVRVKGKKEPVRIYELLAEGTPPPGVEREATRFEEAFDAYHEKRFDEAEAILTELQAADAHALYALYLDRIRTFRQTPPPEDWDGTYTFTSK
jgi:adenylate cyclase